jgi:biopolymer transport protein ExbB
MAQTATGAKASPAQTGGGIGSYATLLIIVGSIFVGILFYSFVLGSSSNFHPAGCDPSSNDCHPVEGGIGQVFGLMYKGGVVVPLALGLLLMLLVFSVERFLALRIAAGTDEGGVFVQKVLTLLNAGQIDAAIAACDKQKGSVGNVTKEVLLKYKQMEHEPGMDKEQKMVAIQKTLEESVALEVPVLQKNMVVIATLVSLGTLVGLIGTVLGMIKAFSALGGGGGAPDAAALAVGISEALINTVVGITTSTIATVSYNGYSASIEALMHRMDEAGFSIVQTYSEKH